MIKINGKTYAGADHKKGTIEWLKQSQANQREYLKAAIEENSDMPEVILMALREVAEARGYETLASEAGLSQKALYRILDEEKEADVSYGSSTMRLPVCRLIHLNNMIRQFLQI